MASLTRLIDACQTDSDTLMQQVQHRITLWDNWLTPLCQENPVGADPDYHDDFQQMREEVNKLFGADTDLICQLAERLLVTTSKDIRVATYYIWARLQRDGEAGLAEGLALLAGLLQRFGTQLHPQREQRRKAALTWLAGSRMLDSLARYPELVKADTLHTLGALLLIDQATGQDGEKEGLPLDALYGALETRLLNAGGVNAVIPQTTGDSVSSAGSVAPTVTAITSGRDLLDQARILADYLRNQPEGWLAAHHLIKSLRHDTLHQLPALTADGRTRIEPPKADQRALLKRLYLQQNWQELLEQADIFFSRGANHLWLDVQWYLHQGLLKSQKGTLAAIIQADLRGLLQRLSGLETLVFNDGTPFADEVTRQWIQQQVMDSPIGWQVERVTDHCHVSDDDAILQWETEAIALADSEGIDAAFSWLSQRPGIVSIRQQWLLRLLMARIAEHYGKNELAEMLLGELDSTAVNLTLSQWEPGLLFEVKARKLHLLRRKAGLNETEKRRLQPGMEYLLAGLITIDPVRAAVLCD